MFKKAGNTERAEKILLWLNTTVPEKQITIKIKKPQNQDKIKSKKNRLKIRN